MVENLIAPKFVGEQYTDDVALIFKPQRTLVSKRTRYQQVDIVKTKTYGKILFLDSLLMKTDLDGHILNEMIVHVPMATGSAKRRVLVIGGGEGFTAKRLLQYPEIEHIDVIDIDSEFVEIAKKYYPEQTAAFLDHRVSLHIVDGLEFIKSVKKPDYYDLILVTTTDPSGLSSPVFTKAFYELCHQKLTSTGIFLTDAYMPYYQMGDIDYRYMYRSIAPIFKITKLYNCTVPSFPGGLFSFVIGSKVSDPEVDLRDDLPAFKTKYYNQALHVAAFKLPQFMLDALE